MEKMRAMATIDYAARRNATWQRIKDLHAVLCDELANVLLTQVKRHVDSVYSCDRE